MGWRSRVQQNWIPQPFYGSHCPIFSLSVASSIPLIFLSDWKVWEMLIQKILKVEFPYSNLLSCCLIGYREKWPWKKWPMEKMNEGKNGRKIKRKLPFTPDCFFCVKYLAKHALKIKRLQGWSSLFGVWGTKAQWAGGGGEPLNDRH